MIEVGVIRVTEHMEILEKLLLPISNARAFWVLHETRVDAVHVGHLGFVAPIRLLQYDRRPN